MVETLQRQEPRLPVPRPFNRLLFPSKTQLTMNNGVLRIQCCSIYFSYSRIKPSFRTRSRGLLTACPTTVSARFWLDSRLSLRLDFAIHMSDAQHPWNGHQNFSQLHPNQFIHPRVRNKEASVRQCKPRTKRPPYMNTNH
jgi:hypothetical protein